MYSSVLRYPFIYFRQAVSSVARDELLHLRNSGRCLHSSSLSAYPDVVVPPLGDSISEGSVAAVLKKAGDQVNADDVIIQIETDKVTIDVKAPETGLVEKLLVNISDVIKPGSLVAVIGSKTSSTAATPTGAAPSASAQQQPLTAAATSSSAEARHHMIAFPPRMAPDGRRISDLPEADAHAVLASLSKAAMPAVHGTPPAAAAPPPAQPTATAQPSPTRPAAAEQPSTKVRTTYLQSAPARSMPTRLEMDMINLGGAMP